MKELLEELDRMDDVASREQDLDPLNWREAQQNSPRNNPYIWAAVINVCRRHQAQSSRLKQFVAACANLAEPGEYVVDTGGKRQTVQVEAKQKTEVAPK